MKSRIQNIGSIVVISVLIGVVPALAALTFTTTAITSDGALTLTGSGASTWDIGTGALSIQTTNNGAITTGSGLFSIGGSVRIGSSSSSSISRFYTTTSSLTLGVIASTTCMATTSVVSYATSTDVIIATPTPVANGVDTVSSTWAVWASATDQITLRVCNPTAANTASIAAQTWRFDVWKH